MRRWIALDESRDPLALDPETMRRLGHEAVDMLVDWVCDSDAPPLRRATPREMRRRLAGPPPEEPSPFEDVLDRLERDVLRFAGRGAHPAFFGFIPCSGTWPGALGDLIASATNIYAGSWMEAAGPSQLELEVLGWFGDWIGYPDEASGILVSGGSAANLTALACAREALVGAMDDRVVAYVGDQAHSSVGRAARVLGFRPEQVRILPTKRDYRLAPRTLAAAIDRDLTDGRLPVFASVSGGSTSTGTVDPLPELAAVCHARGVWLHVDAAYGGFAVLTDRGRAALSGLDLADSVTLDPHKWLYQPYECGCLLLRDGSALRRAFEITPAYLQDSLAGDGEVNFADLGLQLSRSSRALKIWISLHHFGIDAFRRTIDRCLDLAEAARRYVEASDVLELAAEPSLSIVCLRRRFEGADEETAERLNAELVARLEQEEVGFVSSTRLAGRYAVRLCILNHTTGRADVERVLRFLEEAEPAVRPQAARPSRERDATVGRSWLRGTTVETALVAEQPLFRGLAPRELEQIGRLGLLREAAPGEPLVVQGASSRDFYLLVSGTTQVLLHGEPIRELGAGDFFGELAALDWGAGFSYPRLATVIATSPLRAIVFPRGALDQLVGSYPAVAARIRRAVHERLPRH